MSQHANPQASHDDEAEPVDNHSGTRFVLLLFLIPVSFLCGWAGLLVGRQLFAGLGPEASLRAGYVAGGVTMLLVILAIVRWQTALSPRAQSLADEEEELDEMEEEDDDFDRDDDTKS